MTLTAEKRFGSHVTVPAVRERPVAWLGPPVDVTASGRIPAVGERPPRVDTETVTSAGGDTESIETRVPADDMHEENFADVVGKKPVVLLFATPALCQTRVCGPVTDIAAQLQKEYGDRATFIHQEVYEQNKVEKGLREPLRRFGLQSEPWLFTFDAGRASRGPARGLLRHRILPRRGGSGALRRTTRRAGCSG